jgi:hypothetical protein
MISAAANLPKSLFPIACLSQPSLHIDSLYPKYRFAISLN